MRSPTEPTTRPANAWPAHATPVCPELLAPAGDWECARAAVENGADAIYFGLERFNARMRAHNFTEAELPKLMRYLHQRGVKGYVTFNTLVFADELDEALRYLRTIISAGVDAAIVQDVGICRLIRRLSPDFPMHASTQMTVTSAAGVEFARDLGCNLVVLARECSVTEIERIQTALASSSTAGAAPVRFPLEVFVHGALCVAYSGQCLTSEALGGRSANRGECAQACRMPYELISDDQVVPLGDRRYLLSPQDLSGLQVLPDLMRAGVSSLKIEGRLKTPEYVANITQVYRQALDRIVAKWEAAVKDEASTGGLDAVVQSLNEQSRYNLEMGFSRGLYTGWFKGINNQELAHARFGKKRGVYLGAVERVEGQQVVLRLEAPLRLGDGVVFDAGHPDTKEEGGCVYSVQTRHGLTWVGFGYGHINFQRVQAGDRLWKTSDPALERKLRQSFAGDQPHFQRPLVLEVSGQVGEPLRVVAQDEGGLRVEAHSVIVLAQAQKQPLTTARLEEQLGRLGGSPFRLEKLTNQLATDVMLPVSELNRLRRELVARLEELRGQPRSWTLLSDDSTAVERQESPVPSTPTLSVLVRNLSQLDAALEAGAALVYCDFENPKNYREAVERYRRRMGGKSPAGRGIFLAPPRIFKPGEEWILKQVQSADPDGYLVRNYDHLRFFAGARCVGDFSLNVANPITAEYFRTRFGLQRLCASYDLNAAQLEALLQAAPPEWFEITIHQHMPMFHMEHCVFCAFLSKGTNYTNCGRPCDDHKVRLRDRVGAEHPLKADIGCRNTVFNARAQTGAEYVARFLSLGVRVFRVEFVDEPAAEVIQTLGKYHQLLRGGLSGTALWKELNLQNQLGVTRGSMETA